MLKLLVTNNVYVFRYLGTTTFRRLGIEHVVARHRDEVLPLIRSERPEAVLLDVDIAGGGALELCRSIKDDPELGGTPVILLLRFAVTRADLDAIAASSCDDALAMPLHPDDFYHHLAQVTGLPFRRHHRVPVAIGIRLTPSEGEELGGRVVNLSPRGAGVELGAALPKGSAATLQVEFAGQRPPVVQCRVAWCHPSHQRDHFFAGLDFVDIPRQTRSLLEQLALFEVSRGDDEAAGITVCLQGDFDERTDFTALSQLLADEDPIDFNLQAVRYIGSSGVRAWCSFLQGLAGKRYAFRHCSLAFTSQAAMVPLIVAGGEVVSVEAPYHCPACDRDELRLIETALVVHDSGELLPPPARCKSCGGALLFDDIPARYFAFLDDQTDQTKGTP